MSDNSKKLRSLFPAARLKKIMQSNEDVGKMGISVPFIAGKAMELFLKDLVTLTYEELKSKKGNRITVDHIKKAIEENSKYNFLNNLLKDRET
ncbi:class 2 transcription repressor nc2 subunit alpha [Vairimorpha ceranae]|uniref:Class 2 transcription repressor nc2 subunit alpha n=1 Tax=Vairimorpha ceranae TaxID=40302 RepID=A0A0F9YW68_9MICR|nr:class 2 transcription repressor nc2 subunit alpha [Vairimorpha ceranae]KAF5141675.1 hypothetical protein G9O61_00g002170 [Vairimorpha ceranae]KKO76672.1 class 2 transcription repressor nc2 subunit alpha [Vairimorpha ceranae]